ncbi:interleukin-1 receptor-associated kinase 1-binding protein 1 homolog [Cherax quadricarinatus]|uniref:interleukin-1 receptor-associated kinase 1-binding protein 1 homolog n=1 Tax=Cherax quadricarinatus TaxID=27406 RepID=UPI0023798528|nr:uncharacterized protein LOC128694867 [Cherax quadricarinatus]
MEVVEVVGVGEVEVRPQLASLTLVISSQKATIEECRASVEKRRPYVYQTLHNNKAIDEEVTETEVVKVGEAGGLVLIVIVTATLPADAARHAANTLVEKLANNVTLKKLVYRHSWASLSEARVQAGRRAAEEARQRAADMAAAVGGMLGPCLAVKEDACTHVAITEDRAESWVIDTALKRQELHAHIPTIIQSTIKASFSLLSYGVPKTKKA